MLHQSHLRSLVAAATVTCLTMVACVVDDGISTNEDPVADFGPGVEPPASAPPTYAQCSSVDSTREDFAAVQITGAGLPAGVSALTWVRPTRWTYIAPMQGTPGQPAGHEGDDYVHDGASVSTVDVVAASSGTVAYVRTGCPQSATFSRNTTLRECGSGWGNHVVVHHGGELYTRYAHLAPGAIAVRVGDLVSPGQALGRMGNSGRSEVRHLHFELGTRAARFDPCAMSQGFSRVYRGTTLPFGTVSPSYGRIECPAGYALASVGTGGGRLCMGGGNAWGPFTATMVARCRGWGGGDACTSNRWTEGLARAAYGNGACPDGATRDAGTGYCIEGADAFGPFPARMVAECKARGGGDVACSSARWSASLMRWIYGLVNG